MSEQAVAYEVQQPQTISRFQDVHYPDGWLAFRYDPTRGIVEIQRRGQKHYFDLASLFTEALDKRK